MTLESGMLPSVEVEFDRSWGYSIKEKVAPRRLKVEDYALPSHGKKSSWCGETRVRVCREHEKHVNSSLDGVDVAGKDVVEIYRASCGRIECPICYEKAIGKMAVRIEWRYKKRKIRGAYAKPIHVVVSVPPSMYGVDPKKLRSLAEERLQECGVHGGCVIFHPWRERCAKCGAEILREDGKHLCAVCGSAFVVWVVALHFHSIGLGWVGEKAVKEMYERSGWVVVNLGVRKSVRQTAQYQLSHCGVAKGFSNVVWFGSMVKYKNGKRVKYAKLPPEKHDCPLCGSKMKSLVLDPWMKSLMKSSFMDDVVEGLYFVDPEMFDYRDHEGGDG